MRIEHNGISLKVVVDGEGPAVLLLHGFPDSSRLWRYQIPALVQAGYRVIAPDLRGFGESSRPESIEAYGLPLLVGDVIDVLDALGVKQATVVGHDWGAFLGWALAAFMPERVERLIALTVGHPSGFFADPITQRERSWYILFFQFQGVAEEALQRNDWRLARMLMAGHPDLDHAVTDLDRPGALTAGLNYYRANASPALFGEDEPLPLPKVSCPVMGVWASADRALTEAQMVASAQHVQGPWRYERLDGCGHWIPLEAPERLNSLLLEFLRTSIPDPDLT
jgi:pimeloyl-ACP methyl ester carboxylesterase